MPAPKVTLKDPVPKTSGIIAKVRYQALGTIDGDLYPLAQAAIASYVGIRNFSDFFTELVGMNAQLSLDHLTHLRTVDGFGTAYIDVYAHHGEAEPATYAATVRIKPLLVDKTADILATAEVFIDTGVHALAPQPAPSQSYGGRDNY